MPKRIVGDNAAPVKAGATSRFIAGKDRETNLETQPAKLLRPNPLNSRKRRKLRSKKRLRKRQLRQRRLKKQTLNLTYLVTLMRTALMTTAL